MHCFLSRRCTKWIRCDAFTTQMHCRGSSILGRAGHATYPTFMIKDGAARPGPYPLPTLRPTGFQSWAKVPRTQSWVLSICSLATTEDNKAAEAVILTALGSLWENSGTLQFDDEWIQSLYWSVYIKRFYKVLKYKVSKYNDVILIIQWILTMKQYMYIVLNNVTMPFDRLKYSLCFYI